MYTPILRNRQSEILAVKRLLLHTKQNCMPLFDLASPSKAKDVEQSQTYVERNIKRLSEALNGFNQIMIDSSELDPSFRLRGGKHPLTEAAQTIKKEGTISIPVSGLHRDDAHMKAVNRIREEISEGLVCFRLDATDIGTATRSYKMLMDIFSTYSIQSTFVILLLDLQSVFGENPELLSLQVSRFINHAQVNKWRGIIIAGYGIPDRIPQSVPVRGQGYIPRVEQEVFFRILEHNPRKDLWFGDYTSLSPAHVEIDFQIIRKIMGPKVIYALKDSWFVTRGGPFDSHPDGWDQYFKLAANIVALEEFPEDSQYSYGDSYIYERRAIKAIKAGSPGSWITACVNHHITFTADIHASLSST
jgi:hypothetical protein